SRPKAPDGERSFERRASRLSEALDGSNIEALRERDRKKLIPLLRGALIKDEQDVHLFERLAFARDARSLRPAIRPQSGLAWPGIRCRVKALNPRATHHDARNGGLRVDQRRPHNKKHGPH